MTSASRFHVVKDDGTGRVYVVSVAKDAPHLLAVTWSVFVEDARRFSHPVALAVARRNGGRVVVANTVDV